MAYHYVEDKEFLRLLKRDCSNIINELVQAINNDEVMTVKQHLVGSGARNLITQNEKEPIDLDYNLEIIELYGFEWRNGRNIKEYIRKKFNEILRKHNWDDCKDSTSVLTTSIRYYPNIPNSYFSIDLAIVCEDQGNWYRLIHKKTGYTAFDQWYWNAAPHSKGLTKKVIKLKKNYLWNDVRNAYLEHKNMYLSRQDQDHPSFICYIEAVNEVYYQNFK